MNKIYGIVFKDGGKIYNFLATNLEGKIGDHAIVETEKGMQLAKIRSISEVDDTDISMLKPIERIATEKDYALHLSNLSLSEKVLTKARSIANELDLDMNIIDANFTFDKKKLLINFIANDRVDFRELVKKLASIYHTRIELRQIGVRDKAKEIGGLGICGRKLCCASCVNAADSISINMAKNQNIALNPTKINGSCGRLLCCLAYEDEEYTNCKSGLPQVGQFLQTEYGKGNVIAVNILKREYTIRIDNDIHVIQAK